MDQQAELEELLEQLIADRDAMLGGHARVTVRQDDGEETDITGLRIEQEEKLIATIRELLGKTFKPN